MAIEWGPATKASAQKLANAIREVATDRVHEVFAERAERGEFTDYADTHACPITTAYQLATEYGLTTIAARLANGDFDASKEESDEWMKSSSGQELAKELSPAMREVVGMKLNN